MGTDDGLHSDLTRKIIGAALRVRRSLGYGFLEHVYSKFGTKFEVKRRIYTNDRKLLT